MNIKEGKSCILSSTLGVLVFLQQIFGTCVSFHIPKIQGMDTKHCLNWNSFKRKTYLFPIPSRELTYPPKMAFWRWFSQLPKVGYVNFLEGIHHFPKVHSFILNFQGFSLPKQSVVWITEEWMAPDRDWVQCGVIVTWPVFFVWPGPGRHENPRVPPPKCPPLPGSNRSY